ncbi:MAG: RDD family protein, partial [Planctomycetes bacterium]|nr:RDD family protein [Planctomycetota bacterium]
LKNEIQLAPLWRRGAAILLDTFPAGCLAIPIIVKLFPEIMADPMFSETMLQGLNSENPDPIVRTYSIAMFFCFSWTLVAYLTLCEVFFSTTPGKKALQIQVVNHEGQRPSIRQALTRNLIRVIELYGNLIFVVLVLLLFTHKRQRLGDLMARTIVVMKNPQPPKPQENEEDSQPE